jgi:hypothetical protein
MRFSSFFAAFCFVLATNPWVGAQVTLFQETFDNCILPPTWQVNITGNQTPTWSVTATSTNDDAVGQSMNGSCFLLIDDDAEGDNTPAYVIDFVSPPFDCSQHSTIELSMDVHFRDWAEGDESFQILLDNGTTTTVLTSSNGESTGDELWEVANLKFDLSFFSQSPNTRIIIRYDDAGDFNWWAGVDNIKVVGAGTATNIIAESFNACAQPANWQTEIVTGVNNWTFGTATQGNQTMNGSCFAFFDDDALGESAPFSTVRLATPWFDGSEYSDYALTFDLIHRYHKEVFTVQVEHGDGTKYTLQSWSDHVGGPNFDEFVAQSFDISPYRNQQMRVVFQYSDANDWGWWSGIDNVKISGSGTANDLCATAAPLTTAADCLSGSNQNSVFDGPLPACSDKVAGSLWYKWQADFTGLAAFSSKAQFNDVVNVFSGTCANLQNIVCNDYDEHGFIGETTKFQVQSGMTYLIRVSGQEAAFGKPRGPLCVSVNNTTAPPAAPANDNCAQAAGLTIGADCATGTNVGSNISTPQPTQNELARADVWYHFTAPALAAGEYLEIVSNANFSDIITLYSGACANLTEVAANHKGSQLKASGLTVGQTYRVQIAGTFATVEGGVCPQIIKKTETAPSNDVCATAASIPLGGTCQSGNNFNATFSGLTPPCVPYASRDVWFSFVAPATGAIQFNTGADFEHVAAIWGGACGSLEALKCFDNPLRCQGYVSVGDLAPGQTYYLQICSRLGAGGESAGEYCVKLLNYNTPPDIVPLEMQVTPYCIGLDQSKLLVSATGGTPPLTYTGNLPDVALPGNTLFLTIVTDANGCETSVTGTTPECTAACFVNASITATTPICNGGATGALTANISTGNAPYQYNWSNGGTTQTISGLTAGAYSVTVTDANGCTGTVIFQLNAGNPIQVTSSFVPPSTATSNNGSIAIIGSGAYSYSWTFSGDPNQIFEDGPVIFNLAPGTYTVTVTDIVSGCTATATYVLTPVSTTDFADNWGMTLTPNPASELSLLTLKLPDPAELQIALMHTDGRTLRSWTTGAVNDYQHSIPVHDLPAGMYLLRVQSESGIGTRSLVVIR